jgi:hypothetical protein
LAFALQKLCKTVAAASLIVVTTVIGYFFGFLGALIWNRLHSR